MFDVFGGGNLSTDFPVRRQKPFAISFAKVPTLHGIAVGRSLSLVGVMMEGRCRGRGNYPRTHLSGSRLFRPTMTKTLEFKSLSPSEEAFKKNTKQTHIQTAIWKSTLNSEPAALDPVEFG